MVVVLRIGERHACRDKYNPWRHLRERESATGRIHPRNLDRRHPNFGGVALVVKCGFLGEIFSTVRFFFSPK